MSNVPCPTCGSGKKIIKNKKKKESTLLDTLFKKLPFSPRLPLNPIDLLPSIMPANVVFKGGKCPDCNGKRTIPDRTDISKNVEAAAAAASKHTKMIAQHEAELGPPGGNRTTIVAGNETVQVGLAVNKAKSYNIIEGGTHVPSKVHIGDKGCIAGHSPSTYVHGTNPIALPGGNYTLIVGNKLTMVVGAQGVDINTYGPVNISGGITRIIGPQVSVGSSTGQLSLDGKHVQITGDTIALTPSGADKQVVINGTLGVQANAVVAGGLHVDGDVSFTSGTCPMKISRTKFAGGLDHCTQAPSWQGFAVADASRDLLRTVSLLATDPSLVITSPRVMMLMIDKMLTLIYTCMTLEPIPTGLILPGMCVVQSVIAPDIDDGTTQIIISTNITPIPVHNFVHVHRVYDGIHTHDFESPNIKLVSDDVATRTINSSKQSGVPSPANSEEQQSLFAAAAVVGAIANKL